ncbi:MAG: phasin family protein [Steroidobacteraceae bacterium]
MATRSKSKRSKSGKQGQQLRVIDMGNQIWLAGLGALGRAHNAGPKLFQSLVKEGRALQADTREVTEDTLSHAVGDLREALNVRTDAVRDKATETWDNVEKIFQSRVHKALQQLGVPTAREIAALSRKVDQLNRSVQELARARGGDRRGTARRARATSISDTSAPIV